MSPVRRQPAVGVIDAKVQPELCPRSKHAVRLVGTLGNEVVHQDADVSLGAIEVKRRFTAYRKSGVDARHQTLRRRLLIAGRPIDLPGEKQPRKALHLERPVKLRRVDGVVFNGIAGPQHDRVF